MNKHNILSVGCFLALGVLGLLQPLSAAQRDKGDAALQKLQATLKSITSERDAAKTESAKLTTELEQLKKDSAKAAAAAEAAKEQLNTDLAAQKSTNDETKDRLDKTTARLLEVIDKYKALNQSKNELSNELALLKQQHEATTQQLSTCTEHNVKLYEAGKDLLERYNTKGTIAGLLQDEPLLQFNSVEMENILQDYEDKLRSGEYKK